MVCGQDFLKMVICSSRHPLTSEKAYTTVSGRNSSERKRQVNSQLTVPDDWADPCCVTIYELIMGIFANKITVVISCSHHHLIKHTSHLAHTLTSANSPSLSHQLSHGPSIDIASPIECVVNSHSHITILPVHNSFLNLTLSLSQHTCQFRQTISAIMEFSVCISFHTIDRLEY